MERHYFYTAKYDVALIFFKQIDWKAFVHLRAMATLLNFFRLELQFLLRCLEWVSLPMTSAHCCDRKSRAAYAQSFALWQQATVEFTCHDHSPRTLVVTFNRSQANIGRASTPQSLLSSPLLSTINFSPDSQSMLEVTHQDHSIGITLLLLVRATYKYGVVLHAHPVRGESQNQRNTTGEVATAPLNLAEKRKSNLLKNKRILKPIYKLSGAPVFIFSLPGRKFAPLLPRQLRHCNKHFKDLLKKRINFV